MSGLCRGAANRKLFEGATGEVDRPAHTRIAIERGKTPLGASRAHSAGHYQAADAAKGMHAGTCKAVTNSKTKWLFG
jgi:hypothetical protein